MSNKRFYGWKNSKPDFRDYRYSASISVLPPLVDLRPNMPPVYDQLALGDCVGNSVAAAIQFDQMKQNLPTFLPSRLFIYYGARTLEGTIGVDSGCEIRDAVKSVATLGVCNEKMWPYDISKFAINPPAECYTSALLDKVVQYSAVSQDILQMKGCLAEGYPAVVGFTVYDSFESREVARTGIVPMPLPNEGVCGGHCVTLVGYDDHDQMFIVRNSWGTDWGIQGHFLMPYRYLTDPSLADDFWKIELVEQGSMPPLPIPPITGNNPGCFSSFFSVVGKH